MNADQPKQELKLYVVGESSPNPLDWGDWGPRTLVLASNENHARELCESVSVHVTEVALTHPAVLCELVPQLP